MEWRTSTVCVFGRHFALEAAAAGLAIEKLAVYDVPYDTDDDAPQRYQAYTEELHTALGEGRRGDAVELFMRLAGSSDEEIVAGRGSRYWAAAESLAHTLAYDAALYGQPPTDRLATIRQPTLVLTAEAGLGGLGPEFLTRAADAIAEAVPQARRQTLAGQSHVADPKAVAVVLKEFFLA